MNAEALATSRRAIAEGSKSFSLASRLLPARVRDDAVVVYAYCRRADDAVDLAADGDAARALAELSAELDAVYGDGGRPAGVLAAFRDVVRRGAIPRAYPQALLDGLAMDVQCARYDTLADVCAYGFRVAGAVGLMMCHVMGLRDERALLPAAHLGIAMQLTNICRDVAEDWQRARLYLPADRLAAAGAPELAAQLGERFPSRARAPVAQVVESLLAEAERFYASGDRGLWALSPRCRLGVRAARLIYAEIGVELARRGFDPLAGRAVVSRRRKLRLVGRAAMSAIQGDPGPVRVPRRELTMAEALSDPDTGAPLRSALAWEHVAEDRASGG
jgi:15-cis-phytoene synthase